MLKLCGAAVISIILSAVLKVKSAAFSPYLTEITSILIITSAITTLVPLFDFIKGLISKGAVSGNVYETLIKSVFIATVCHVIYDVCKENGEQMLAGAVEFAGNAEIMVLSLPLITSLLKDAFALFNV